ALHEVRQHGPRLTGGAVAFLAAVPWPEGEEVAVGSDSVLVKAEEGFTTITMNRPERRNALSLDLLRDLTAAFRAAGDSDARGVILAANGPVFSAGHDFRDLADADAASIRELLDSCTELMLTMQAIPQPVVASVHGLATAAGCQPVATADQALGSGDDAFRN